MTFETHNGVAVVVTDSGAALPQELSTELGIGLVPMEVRFGDQVYRDGVDLRPSDFYRLLRERPEHPSTSAPPPQAFLDAFENAGLRATAVLCITVARRFSASYDAAMVAVGQAHRSLPGLAIRVFDSRTAAAAQGLVALAAARAAKEGSLADAEVAAHRAVATVRMVALVDTLTYLRRSGRVPGIAAMAAGLLQIKPIFELAGDEPVSLEKPRTRPRAIERLLALTADRANGRLVDVNVMHTACPDDARALEQHVTAQLRCRDTWVSEAGPVIGAHLGPGLLALAVLPVP
jgi:DegV family protein with EDD domain